MWFGKIVIELVEILPIFDFNTIDSTVLTLLQQRTENTLIDYIVAEHMKRCHLFDKHNDIVDFCNTWSLFNDR